MDGPLLAAGAALLVASSVVKLWFMKVLIEDNVLNVIQPIQSCLMQSSLIHRTTNSGHDR